MAKAFLKVKRVKSETHILFIQLTITLRVVNLNLYLKNVDICIKQWLYTHM